MMEGEVIFDTKSLVSIAKRYGIDINEDKILAVWLDKTDKENGVYAYRIYTPSGTLFTLYINTKKEQAFLVKMK